MKLVVLKFLHLTSKQFVRVMSSLLFIFLLLVGTMILLTEAIEDRRTEIAEWVSNTIGYPVEIGGVGVYWFDLEPELIIRDVRIEQQDMSSDLLSFEEVRLGLDIFASLYKQEPVFSELSVRGMDLIVLRDDNGKLQVEGIPFDSTLEGSSTDWTYLATILEHFSLENIKLTYIDKLDPEVSGVYEINQLLLIHEHSNWSWTGNIVLPSTLGDKLSLTGHLLLEDSGFAESQWDWEANVDDLSLATFAKGRDLFGISMNRGKANVRIEGKAVGLDITSAIANVKLSDSRFISVSDDTKVSPVAIDRFSGIFYWEKNSDKWSIRGDTIQLQINDDLWPTSQFSVEKDSNGLMRVGVSYLQLSDVLAFALLSNKWPMDLHQQLLKQQPSGDIQSLNLEYSATSEIQEFAVTVQDFSVSPWQKIPGVTGLSGQFNLNDKRAKLDINSREVSVYVDDWLDEALFFDSISGVLRWQQKQQGWKLQSETLHVWNDDLTLQLDGTVELQDGEIINDIVITLQDVITKNWKKYVPSKVMLADLEEWAIPAFVDGLVTDGKITWKGPLSQFPYLSPTDKGTFDINLHTRDAQLHYAPGWPDIIGVTGTITGNGNDLIIKSQFGTIAGFEFVDVTTTIRDLATDNPVILRVDGDIAGTAEHAIQFLEDSPLNETFGAYIDSLVVSGHSDVHLELMVPLSDPYATKASGSVSLKDSTMQRKDLSDITLTAINGKLNFTETGLSADAIKANLLGGLIQVDVKTVDGEGDQATTTIIDVLGTLATKETATNLKQALPDFISGQTSYEMQIKLAEAKSDHFNVDMHLKSDLAGLKIDLPAPIGKSSTDEVPLSLDLALLSNGAAKYFGNYGNQLNALLEQKDQQWRGEIRLGNGKAILPTAGVRLRGGLAEVSLAAWQNIQMDSSTDEGSWANAIDDVSLQFGLLTAYEQQLHDLSISAQRAADVWVLQLNSNEIAGKVHWPLNKKAVSPIEANLKLLHIKLPDTADKQKTSPSESSKLWPSINFQCDDFQIDEMNFGKVSLKTHQQNRQWIVDSLEMVSPVLTLSGTGDWEQSDSSDKSQINLVGKTSDLAAFLTSFGYQADIEANRAEMSFNLNWPGSPADFSVSSALGEVSIDIGKGKLQKVDPGAAGRVFGFLSIAMIPNLLSLDFSDLFGEGLGFDSIAGDFNIIDGQAHSNNFVMKGPRAEIEMKGRLGLVDHDYDQKIQIRPNLGSTLPLAGAVAGGPVGFGIGAAIMLADKVTGAVLGKNLVNVVKYKYQLTGTWSDPIVKRLEQ